MEATKMNAQVMNLPILKHLDSGAIAKNAENQINKFRKGEKPVYNLLRLAIIGGLGYLTWVYVLPPIFQAIGQFMAVAATGVLIVLGILAAPLIFKFLKKLVRKGHELMIKYDPFSELYNQLEKMIENGRETTKAKSNIRSLESEMKSGAANAEKEVSDAQKDILKKQKKAQELKTEIETNLKTKGETYKQEDEYVDLQAQFTKLLADANRISIKMEQSKDFVTKYGSRAAIMKKTAQKLTSAEAAIEIKIEDFKSSIEILKADYDFTQKAKSATDKAKAALQLTSGWELNFALDVITSTIADDIATTASNLKDIDKVTSEYQLDNDELFSNLNTLADNIKTGQEIIPDSKKYNNPDYKLTSEDKEKSGGLEQIF